MSNNFKNQLPVGVPEGLFAKVMLRIEAERGAISVRWRFAGLTIVCAAIFALSIPVWHSFSADIASSGLGQFTKLAFSDFSSTVANWQDFSLELLESLPIISTVSLLAVIFSFLLSLKFAVKYSQEMFSKKTAH